MSGIPTYEELMGPLLRGLEARGQAGVRDLDSELAEEFRLSDEQKEETTPKTNVRVLNSRMHFAKWYLLKAGLIVRVKHGIYKITENGRSVLASGDKVDSKYLEENCEEFRNWRNITTDDAKEVEEITVRDDQPSTVDENDSEDHVESEVTALEFIKELKPTTVELIVVELLKIEAGNESAKHTGGPKDRGIDAIFYSGPFGVYETGVQVKCLKDKDVDYTDMHNFLGALASKKMSGGIFVTTSKFSEEAEEIAINANIPIKLIEGEDFAERIVYHNIIRVQGGKVPIDDIIKIRENSKRKK